MSATDKFLPAPCVFCVCVNIYNSLLIDVKFSKNLVFTNEMIKGRFGSSNRRIHKLAVDWQLIKWKLLKGA